MKELCVQVENGNPNSAVACVCVCISGFEGGGVGCRGGGIHTYLYNMFN